MSNFLYRFASNMDNATIHSIGPTDIYKDNPSLRPKEFLRPDLKSTDTPEQIKDKFKKFAERVSEEYTSVAENSINQRRKVVLAAMYAPKSMRDPSKTEVHVLDSTWNSGNIMTPFMYLPTNVRAIAFKSNAHIKFQDSSLGGSYVLNPLPQFTRYADIRANDLIAPFIGLRNKNKDGDNATRASEKMADITFGNLDNARGMGRYYSEALDDHKQMVYLQFGVPKFNGLLSFFTNSVSYEDTYIATYGRKPSVYQWTKTITDIARWIMFPFLSGVVFLAKLGIQFLVGNKPFQYYYLEPAMHVYWSTVNTIATHLGLSMGILGSVFDANSDKIDKDNEEILGENDNKEKRARLLLSGKGFKVNREFVRKLNAAFGDANEKFIDPVTGFVDVYYLATRMQQRANTILKNKYAADDGKLKDGNELTTSLINFYYGQHMSPDGILAPFFSWTNQALSTYKKDMATMSEQGSAAFTSVPSPGGEVFKDTDSEEEESSSKDKTNKLLSEDVQQSSVALDPESGKLKVTNVPEEVSLFGKAWNGAKGKFNTIFDKAFATSDAVARGAASFVILRVNYTGGSSESFSNSTGEIQTGGAVKGFSQALKHKRFSFSNGQTGIDIVDSITSGAMQVMNGILDSATFGLSNVVRGMLLGAIVDMPKIWEDSSISLPNVSYSVDLVSPYSNPLSRFQNIIVPLSVLLAGALPIRAGKASYTSPFLCSAFSKSVQHIKLGMITDLSIQRGITNLAYSNDRVPNGITVSFTVTDFAPKLAAPVNPTMFKSFQPIIEEDTPLADYFNIIGGRDLWDMEFYANKLQFRAKAFARNLHDLFRVSRPSGLIGELIYKGPLSALLPNMVKDITETASSEYLTRH